jgi:acetate---CoA ligase (ADP-forming)
MNKTTTLNTECFPISNFLTLEHFFDPKKVAVIGASLKPGNLGKRIVDSLIAQGFEGSLIAVHPNGESWRGCSSVKSVRELPDDVDLAISAVSAERVEALVEPLVDRGIHHLIVVGGGFSETGPEGELLQNSLKETARNFGVRIIGPNCLGTFSSPDKFNSFFLSLDDIRLPPTGSIAIISQSGAFMSAILDQLASRGVGVHRAINFGNRIDIGECEALEAFASDPQVEVIGIYLEGVQSGRRFFETVRKIAAVKPIVICKGGKSAKGNRATQAHSASLAGSYEVFNTVCEQAGMIEVQGLSELVNALHVLSLEPVPQGNRVLIVSNGGGMGVLLTDLCERAGCVVDEPSPEIQEELKNSLPTYFSLKNPIDLTGSGTNAQCAFILDKLLNSGLYDCLLLVILSGTEGINADIASQIRCILPEEFPVVIGAYGKEMYPKLCASFKGENIPVFPSGEEAAGAINLLSRTEITNSNSKTSPAETEPSYSPLPLYHWLDQVDQCPDEMQLKQKFLECGVEIPRSLPVLKHEDLHEVIEAIGFPLILKVVGKDIKHKTELKGIRPDLYHENDLVSEWRTMNKTWPGQIWAEQQMPPGLDLMVGMHRDIDFGPVLLFGTGGQYVEIYKDIERIILPAEEEEILQAIFRTQAGQIIKGVRGGDPLDIQKLLGFIKLIVEWVEKEPEVFSLDFNPIRLYNNSLVVLDAKLTTKSNF